MSKWWLYVDDKRIKRPATRLNLPLARDLPDHVKDRIIKQECEKLNCSHAGAKLLRVNEV